MARKASHSTCTAQVLEEAEAIDAKADRGESILPLCGLPLGVRMLAVGCIVAAENLHTYLHMPIRCRKSALGPDACHKIGLVCLGLHF